MAAASASSVRPTVPNPPQVAATPKVTVSPPPESTVPSAAPATVEPSAVASAEPTPSAEPVPPASVTVEPPVTAQPEPTTAPTPTTTSPPPVAAGETPGPVEDIIFELDSLRLSPAAKTILEGVVQNLKANPSLKVHVRGHSDRMGSREHNLELSRKRAASVENFLHGVGIPGSRITTEAMGGRKPVVPENTPAAWARNRRVEIEWR